MAVATAHHCGKAMRLDFFTQLQKSEIAATRGTQFVSGSFDLSVAAAQGV